ncbi:hypothetical protein PVL29_026711 [Vitis rotundifolia]|uniref:ABC transporter domain-containing protein n=1 Tax=Vitis rotundifolia TaxID=103349 RepID=A0AA38YH37_VITRO|nr:hypothetical protein PVL29_026711 [Vitis rotundifolia]
MAYANGHRRDAVIVSIGKPVSLTGGLEFSDLTYTVKKKEKIEGKWVSQEVDLLHMISGYAPKGSVTGVMGPSGAGKSTFLDGLAGRISSGSLKGGRTSAYIMQEDLLFPMLTVYETLMFAADFRLGPLSWMDKKLRVDRLIEQLGLTSSRNTYIGDEGVRGVSGGERRRVSIGADIIHGPSLLFLDEPTSGLDSTSAYSVIEKVHDIARAGSTVILTIHQPSSRILLLLDHLIDVGHHLRGMDRKVPKGENPVEYLIDVIQEYNQSEHGVEVVAAFARTGLKPPPLSEEEVSMSTVPPTPTPRHHHASPLVEGRRLPLQAGSQRSATDFDRSLRSLHNSSRSWSASHSGIHLGPKFANSFLDEIWILMRRNFINIRRTPELFLSRLLVLTVMGVMMATMFTNPGADIQGITSRLSFFIFTVCLFFFSSNDAVPAFIQERFIFVRETGHNAYRASTYTIAGLITYLPFFAVQAGVYAGIVWFALKLRGPFYYSLIVLYMSLLSTNSFVVFVSSVVPNYILGYAAVIAFTALFFLFCGYFLNGDDIPPYWKWMNKVSTMTYPYEGLLMNQYQTNDTFGVNPGGQNITGNDILNQLNVSIVEFDKWKNVFIMVGWAVLYRVLFYIVLRFASKNQRT